MQAHVERSGFGRDQRMTGGTGSRDLQRLSAVGRPGGGEFDIGVPIGIMTITPSEGAMIAADVAAKAANVAIGFVDRFNGSLVITGDVAAVEAALKDVMRVLCDMMGFSPASISKT